MAAEEKYIVQSLLYGLKLLKIMMNDLSPARSYSVPELVEGTEGLTYQQVFRILKTCQVAGFIESDENCKKYRLSQEILLLSHRYLLKLKAEHDLIKSEVAKFKIEV